VGVASPSTSTTGDQRIWTAVPRQRNRQMRAVPAGKDLRVTFTGNDPRHQPEAGTASGASRCPALPAVWKGAF